MKIILLLLINSFLFLGCSDAKNEKDISDKVKIEKRYDKKGYLASEFSYDSNLEYHGVNKVYYPNGQLKSSTKYTHGLYDGEQQFYFETGELSEVITYLKGERTGATKSFYKNGKLSYIVDYKNGHRDGKNISYYKNGNIEYEMSYLKGAQYDRRLWYTIDGKLKGETLFENGLVSSCYEYLTTEKKQKVNCLEYEKSKRLN